jgi:hypothetical protein
MLTLNESNFKILSASPDIIVSQEHVNSHNIAGMKVENQIIRGSGGPSLLDLDRQIPGIFIKLTKFW